MIRRGGPTTWQGDGARANESSQHLDSPSEAEQRQANSTAQPLPPIHPLSRRAHPAALLLPPLSPEEYAGLVASIREHGLLEPIKIWAGPSPDYVGPVPEHVGTILDGVYRQTACFEAGVEPRYVDVFDPDPVGYALACNIHRRHLDTRRKRQLIENLLRFDPRRGDRWIAKATGTTHPTVAVVREELELSGAIPVVTETVGADGIVQRRWKNLPPDEEGGGVEPSVGDTDLPVEGEAETPADATTPVDLSGAIRSGEEASHDEASGDEPEASGDEPEASHDEASHDEASHDEASGDEAEVETSSSDEVSDSEVEVGISYQSYLSGQSEDAIMPEFEIDWAFRNKLTADELRAYDQFTVNARKKVEALRLSWDDRATLMAMRVRQLLGGDPSTAVASNSEVVRLRKANNALEDQCAALESQVEELKAKNTQLKAKNTQLKAKNTQLKANLAAARLQATTLEREAVDLKAALNKGPAAEGTEIREQPQPKSKKSKKKKVVRQ